MDRIVIGIVGPISSGKGVISSQLQGLGYRHYSLSDRIREELALQNLVEDRKGMQDMGDHLRYQFGYEELARRTLDLINETRETANIVIESIRHLGEVSYLTEASNLGAIIIGISASTERRFELCLLREREGDPITLEEFKKMDNREFAGGDHGEIDIAGCLKLASFVVDNEVGDENILIRRFQEGMQNIGINLEGVSSQQEKLR